jgi:hypothetical protein
MTTKNLGRTVGLMSNSSVRLNIVAPVVAYFLLTKKAGMTTVDALAISAVFPAAGGVLGMLRGRRLDPLSLLSLAGIAVGVIAGLIFHNGRILLVKESLTTGTLGVVFLSSLFARQPLMFALRRRLFVPDQPDARDEYERTWQSPAVRAEVRRTTAIWGIALLAEAALRVGLSYQLPVGTMVAISPLLAPLTLAPLGIWTLRPRSGRISKHKASGASVVS